MARLSGCEVAFALPKSFSGLPNLPRQNLGKQMPVAVRRIFIAVTHQGDVSTTSKLLDQPQCELLSVILDPLVGSIESSATAEEFTSVLTTKGRPTCIPSPE